MGGIFVRGARRQLGGEASVAFVRRCMGRSVSEAASEGPEGGSVRCPSWKGDVAGNGCGGGRGTEDGIRVVGAQSLPVTGQAGFVLYSGAGEVSSDKVCRCSRVTPGRKGEEEEEEATSSSGTLLCGPPCRARIVVAEQTPMLKTSAGGESRLNRERTELFSKGKKPPIKKEGILLRPEPM